MFPLSIIQYVKLGAIVIGMLFSVYIGYRFEHNNFMGYKAKIELATRVEEQRTQTQADEIRKVKDAQIRDINSKLVYAISQLRSRSNSPTKTINGQDCNGATLSAQDAEFLVREASRADQIRVGLEACYKQYDAVAK